MSLHYSIYKVQCCSFALRFWLAANFYMLAHLIHFVKNFFQVFQSFLSCRYAPGCSPFITQLCHYNTLFPFVKNFFQVSANFFSVLCGPRGQLGYISTPYLFCQALFHKMHPSFLLTFTHGHSSTFNGIPLFWTVRC